MPELQTDVSEYHYGNVQVPPTPLNPDGTPKVGIWARQGKKKFRWVFIPLERQDATLSENKENEHPVNTQPDQSQEERHDVDVYQHSTRG